MWRVEEERFSESQGVAHADESLYQVTVAQGHLPALLGENIMHAPSAPSLLLQPDEKSDGDACSAAFIARDFPAVLDRLSSVPSLPVSWHHRDQSSQDGFPLLLGSDFIEPPVFPAMSPSSAQLLPEFQQQLNLELPFENVITIDTSVTHLHAELSTFHCLLLHPRDRLIDSLMAFRDKFAQVVCAFELLAIGFKHADAENMQNQLHQWDIIDRLLYSQNCLLNQLDEQSNPPPLLDHANKL
jgi:hypothetical protein